MFRNVTLLKDEYLGRGAYGVVYRAKCDQLYCAAKYLHPIFFETNDPGGRRAVDIFRAECDMLRQLHHPNIVQYLGTRQEEGSNSIVLLMEEMDCSLNSFLSKHRDSPLPFHREVDLMFDVSLAIDYLHANNIYHRDLSSKNILLKGDKAKVSDFGVAKLRDPNAGYSSDTACPGNIVYMPPEVLQVPPRLEKTLDEFSMGVVMIEIMSRQDPRPTGLHVERESNILEIIPENMRRKLDIELCNQLNPMLQIALSCLSNDHNDRPFSDHISRLLSLLQTTTEYKNSMSDQSRLTDSMRDENDFMKDVVRIDIKDDTGLLKELDILRMKLKEQDHKIAEQQRLLVLRENQLQEYSTQTKQAEDSLLAMNIQVQQQTERIQHKERTLQECYTNINKKDQIIFDLENTIKSRDMSLEVIKKQQIDVDQRVSDYITQIDILQSHVTEMQSEIKALNLQLVRSNRELKEKEVEVRDTRSRLITREGELMNSTLKGIQSLKKLQ